MLGLFCTPWLTVADVKPLRPTPQIDAPAVGILKRPGVLETGPGDPRTAYSPTHDSLPFFVVPDVTKFEKTPLNESMPTVTEPSISLVGSRVRRFTVPLIA